MKRRKLEIGTPVQCAWLDSMTHIGWHAAQHEDGDLAQIASIGYVVNTTHDALVLSTSIGTKGLVLDPVSIPWKSIVAFRKLDNKPKETEARKTENRQQRSERV